MLFSGAAALMYEVLWIRDMVLLFGAAGRAVAVVLSMFFLGMSVGAWAAGRFSAWVNSPLRAYAFVEWGLALCAGWCLFMMGRYETLTPWLFELAGGSAWLLLAGKGALAFAALFPPAFCMGATWPLMTEHAARIRRSGGFARVGAFLYAANTMGAVAGALLAGFVLPPTLGFQRSYLLAMGVNVVVGAAACVWAGRRLEHRARAFQAPRAGSGRPARDALVLAFVSGVLTLGLETLWTRMLAQVLQNSVYTFSAVLAVFLLALAAGGAAAGWLAEKDWPERRVLAVLLGGGAVGVLVSAPVFYVASAGMRFYAPELGWAAYMARVFGLAALVCFLPTFLLGVLFPYLLKRIQQSQAQGGGAAAGRLAAMNTVGAVLGPLLAGFALLPLLGLWGALGALASGYAVLAIPYAREFGRAGVVGSALVTVLALVSGWVGIPLVDVGEGARLVDVIQGERSTVAVLEEGGELWLKVNNHYALAHTGTARLQRFQAQLPLLLHPDARDVYFLGMGTGITAAGALVPGVRSVTVCELLPEVIEASRRHFGAWTGGLFRDPRARVLAEDGRNRLMASPRSYDLIIADLFRPWRAGVGALYTKEHFAMVRKRLNAGGLFVQWLPLHHHTQEQFFTILRTMRSVFPFMTFWRLNFWPNRPSVALVGHVSPPRYNAGAAVAAFRRMHGEEDISDTFVTAYTLTHYAGNLSEGRWRAPPGPVNTDDRPVLEYVSPMAERERAAGRATWFFGRPLILFMEKALQITPPRADSFLEELSPRQREYVHAGLELYRYKLDKHEAPAKAEAEVERFKALTPKSLWGALER